MSPTPTNPGVRARVERFVEVAVFAPLGIALTLRDMAPTFINMFVSRGRAEIDRHQHSAEKQLQTIRSTGEVALAFGAPIIKKRITSRIDRLRGRNDAAPTVSATTAHATNAHATNARATVASDERPTVAINGSGPSSSSPSLPGQAVPGQAVSGLSIPGYDELAASQVVERLVGLSGVELGAVRAYEAAHRNRRTILGKIDQLATS